MRAPTSRTDDLSVECLALRQLGLQDEHLARLRQQGFISTEWHHGKQRCKLRLRDVIGRQVVLCIPNDLVAAVQQELDQLQCRRRVRQELREATRTVRRANRAYRAELGRLLEPLGFHAHGTAIRRRRKAM